MESNITNKQSFDELSYPIGPGDLMSHLRTEHITWPNFTLIYGARWPPLVNVILHTLTSEYIQGTLKLFYVHNWYRQASEYVAVSQAMSEAFLIKSSQISHGNKPAN
jgi:hypothetical protein